MDISLFLSLALCENVEEFITLFLQVQEARAAADKAKQLLQNVANRKQKKQQEVGGLVITKALYGSVKALKKRDEPVEPNDELSSQFIDVALPLNFLVSDDGQLKVCCFSSATK